MYQKDTLHKITSQEFLETLMKNNGPEESEYAALDEICNQQPEVLEQINKETIDFLMSKDSIMGHILLKPYGYAGDFEIIDRIYTEKKSEQFPKWDNYSLSNSAAIAVRNRKEYFKTIIQEKIHQQKELTILNIASGPARDVFEIFEELVQDKCKVKFTCVDLDESAIQYAKKLNSKYLNNIEFIHKNIFRFDTQSKFDLVWSAGLFDYFNNKTFVSILNRAKNWVKPKGEIVIGNFNEHNNPSRKYMEIIGEWYLHHRSEEELRELAVKAGFLSNNIRVGNENENVNLFLHMKNEQII